jgi:hypothetical protein
VASPCMSTDWRGKGYLFAWTGFPRVSSGEHGCRGFAVVGFKFGALMDMQVPVVGRGLPLPRPSKGFQAELATLH